MPCEKVFVAKCASYFIQQNEFAHFCLLFFEKNPFLSKEFILNVSSIKANILSNYEIIVYYFN